MEPRSLRSPRSRLAAVLVLALLLAAPGHLRAELPTEGWPHPRRDAALTGRSSEPALRAPTLQWSARVSGFYLGEPAVLGCLVHVVGVEGDVHAFHAHSGEQLWSYRRSGGQCGGLEYQECSLAVDDERRLHVGLQSDRGLARTWFLAEHLQVGLGEYFEDHGEFPEGTDLRAALQGDYIEFWPRNACTDLPLAASEAASPGDYRYERVGTDAYHLGMWWTDLGLLEAAPPWARYWGALGLAPAWPVSTDFGSRLTVLDASTGALLWEDEASGAHHDARPSLSPEGTWWSSFDKRQTSEGTMPTGQRRLLAPDGTQAQLHRNMDWPSGSVARDEESGLLYTIGAGRRIGQALSSPAGSIARAIESWRDANGALPPVGELHDLLVPAHLPVMPDNALTGETAVHSATPSPGDYDYRQLGGGSYQVGFWDDVNEFSFIVEDGLLVLGSAANEAPTVTCHEPDGAIRWRVRTSADVNERPTPLALTGDGGLVFASYSGELVRLEAADGGLSWRARVDAPVFHAPVVHADGRVVVADLGGRVTAFLPNGEVAWSRLLEGGVGGAPTGTGDGVTYVPERSGHLSALGPAGLLLWRIELPGSGELMTAAVQSDGWLYLGREDGTLLAYSEPEHAEIAADSLLLLPLDQASGRVGFRWEGDVPEGHHAHLWRFEGRPAGPARQLLGHVPGVREHEDAEAGGPLRTYVVVPVDCGGEPGND